MIEPLQSDDALLADIESVPGDRSRIDIWWLGQSGFLCRGDGETLLFDPYLSDSLTRKYASTEKPHVRMSRRVVAPERLGVVDYLTSTHMHTDHADAETIGPIARASWAAGRVPIMFAPKANLMALVKRLPQDGMPAMCDVSIRSPVMHDSLRVTSVPAAHPEIVLDAEGEPQHVGFVVQFGSFTLYHSGDGVVYEGMADSLRGFDIDLAILPINGKVGDMNGTDAARLAKDINARLVVPCHYHMFEFNTAEPGEQFIPECERLQQPYRVLRLGERLTLEKP